MSGNQLRVGSSCGNRPSCHCLPTPGKTDSLSGCGDSRWVASALPPRSASPRTTQQAEKGAASPGESRPCWRASPLSKPLAHQGLNLHAGLSPSSGNPRSWTGEAHGNQGVCVCEGHTFSPKLHTEIHLDSIPGLNSFCSFEDAKQKEQQNAKRKVTK